MQNYDVLMLENCIRLLLALLALLCTIWKHLRWQKGLTQEMVAEVIGVDVRTVQRWEDGTHEPRPQHQMQLQQLYQLTDEGLDVAIPKMVSPVQVDDFLQRIGRARRVKGW